MTRKYIQYDKFTAFFLTLIDKQAYNLLKYLAFSEKLISLSYELLKESLVFIFSVPALNPERDQSFMKCCDKVNRKRKTLLHKCNFECQLGIQICDLSISGINIPNLEEEFIQKSRSSI